MSHNIDIPDENFGKIRVFSSDSLDWLLRVSVDPVPQSQLPWNLHSVRHFDFREVFFPCSTNHCLVQHQCCKTVTTMQLLSSFSTLCILKPAKCWGFFDCMVNEEQKYNKQITSPKGLFASLQQIFNFTVLYEFKIVSCEVLKNPCLPESVTMVQWICLPLATCRLQEENSWNSSHHVK